MCLLGPEGDLHGQARLVLGHRDHQQVAGRGPAVRRRPVERREVGVGERVDELASPVRAEVDVDDRVAVAQHAVHAVDYRRHHELVRLAAGIGAFDRGRRRRGMLPHPVHDRVVATFGALPALVPVHRPVAPAHRCDPGVGMHGAEARLQLAHEPERRARWRVPAIEQGMDADRRHARPGRQLDQRHEVAIVGVDPTGPDQAHRVKPARLAGPLGTRRAAPAVRRSCRPRSRHRSAAGPGARVGRHRGSGGRPPSCPSGRRAARPRPPRPGARRAANGQAARASAASPPPRSHPRCGHGRCRSRRGRRG